MNLVLLGLQGSGKGEQATRLAKRRHLSYFPAGDLLREKAKDNSALGKAIHQTINVEGKMLPDELMNQFVFEILAKIDGRKGIVFDGYPRTAIQFEFLEQYLKKRGQKIDKVIYLEINEETALKRLSSRRICQNCQEVFNLVTDPPEEPGLCDRCRGELEQRKDDSPALIKNRLADYQKQTQPLIDLVRKKGILIEVDGEKPIEAVFQAILTQL